MKMTPGRIARMKAEYDSIVDALKKTNFNQGKAAELLGVSRRTIYNKIRKYKQLSGVGETEKSS